MPVGTVEGTGKVWADAHIRHRVVAAEIGAYKAWGLPVKFSRAQLR